MTNSHRLNLLLLTVAITSLCVDLKLVHANLSSYLVDYNIPLNLGFYDGSPLPQDQQAGFISALQILYFIVGFQYPWLDSGDFPDPIPQELLMPFSDFITINHLDALIG